MTDWISTHYQKGGFSTADRVVLEESARTRVVFVPGIHRGGVRGHIIRQKIGADGSWKDANEVNFTTLPPDCGVKLELGTAATSKLYEKLDQLYALQKQGAPTRDQEYVVAKDPYLNNLLSWDGPQARDQQGCR